MVEAILALLTALIAGLPKILEAWQAHEAKKQSLLALDKEIERANASSDPNHMGGIMHDLDERLRDKGID